MAGIIEPDLVKYFSFLSTDYEFEKKEEYFIGREVFNDYFKNGILIKFIFDGTLRVNIRKVKNYSQSNSFSVRNFRKIILLNQETDQSDFQKIYNEEGLFRDQANLISDTLISNPGILKGKLFKLTGPYQLYIKIWRQKKGFLPPI